MQAFITKKETIRWGDNFTDDKEAKLPERRLEFTPENKEEWKELCQILETDENGWGGVSLSMSLDSVFEAMIEKCKHCVSPEGI